MTVKEIEDGVWYVATVTGVIQDTHRWHTFTALLGQNGYLKRNDHQKDYYQLVAYGVDKIVHGFYVKASVAESSLEVLHEAQGQPDLIWRGYFQNLKFGVGAP